ncbi:Proteophosphoglycan 5 [Ceratobasidium theobromae]|uniref:Proteophosphoglycan 5 n=1 Tax=Ceratobasidium theobromae TaxID=1582974 RepID=A0A5N5QLQ8_9AGAM|nr:Proteophosphoglycan 5 [Ceratobasidium theobromae]
MSSETLVLRMSSSSSSSLVGEGPSAPFLAEEAYPLILRALVETGLGEEIWLSEDNIGVVAGAASRALFGQNGVFSQFLVVPRVECAISVLLWRVRVNATCEGVPRVPIHVLASSLAGLLDNTKLYASKQGAMLFIWVDFVNRFAALHSPMTKRVKFDPPPIITRTTPTRSNSRSQSSVTLTFAAALAEYQVEPYHPDETPEVHVRQSSPTPMRPPSPEKRVLRKPPPKGKEKRPESPTKRSMWAPAGEDAHFRNNSSVRTLAGRLPRRALDVGELGDDPGVDASNPDLPARTPSPNGRPTSLNVLHSPGSNLLGSPSSMYRLSTSSAFGSPPSLDRSVSTRSPSVDGMTIIAVSAEATPVTPTPRRTFNRTPSPSPGAISLGSSPVPLGISPGPSISLSPGAISLSTVPSLSPFPESDSEAEFGVADADDLTVTAKMRAANGSPVRRGPKRSTSKRSPSPAKRKLPLPPRTDASPTRSRTTSGVALRALSKSPPTRTATPPRTTSPKMFGTPTKQNPLVPNRSWTDSPSRASTYVGVPMTQVPSRPRTLSTQTRSALGHAAESGVSESEAESLPFPGSQSTLSLPGYVSLPEVSPFTAPKDLPSSEDERPSPWLGPGVTSSPWNVGGSSGSPSPWIEASLELSDSGLLSASLPAVEDTASARTSVETSRPRSGSVPRASVDRARSSVEHSGPRSVDSHATSASTLKTTHPGLGLRTGQDILVPFIPLRSKSVSRTDVIKLLGRNSTLDSPFPSSGESSPGRGSPVLARSPTRGLEPVTEYNQPTPVFMVPGTDPALMASDESRPTSWLRSQPQALASPLSSADSTTSPVLFDRPPHSRLTSETSIESAESVVVHGDEDGDGEAMVRTSEVGVGAGRARVHTGVGVGVGGARRGVKLDGKAKAGAGGARARVDSNLAGRVRVDSVATSRARVNSATGRARVDSATGRARVDSATGRTRVDSTTTTRPPAKARIDTGLRRKSGQFQSQSQSPTAGSPATPTSASTTSARRVPVKKVSNEAGLRTRRPSNNSMRKSSMSSLRSAPSSVPPKKTTRTPSFSSGTSTRSVNGGVTPKAGTPRTSTSSGRASIASPKPNIVKSTVSPKASAATLRTSVAVPRSPPSRPQRSSLRPSARTSIAETASINTAATDSPRMRTTSIDTRESITEAPEPRPRRATSISKPSPLSRSSVAPPVPAAATNWTPQVKVGRPSNDVPFPSPSNAVDSKLQVPTTPNLVKRSLSVGSAARKLVSRARGASPVPPTPQMDAASLAPSTAAISTDASSMDKSPPKPVRSLSRLAFSALLPKRNNAAAEAKVALAQAKARQVAEAKAKAKAAAEEAKARARAEAEEVKAARAAAKAKEEKEPKKLSKRFGSLSKRGGGLS